MHERNSFLIKPTGRLVPVDERLAEARPLYRGHRWAEVTVDEVRRVLRLAYEDRDVLARVARQGMHEVREGYSHERAATRMRDYLLSMSVPSVGTGRPRVRIQRPPLLHRVAPRAALALRTGATTPFRQ